MGLSAHYCYFESVRDDPDGLAWAEEKLSEVNYVLRANGLREHVEKPAELPPHTYRCQLGSIGWSWLHCLRRLYALTLQNSDAAGWRPVPAPQDYPGPDLDPVIDKELFVFIRSHLIVHSDSEGWYVPVDFEDILTGDGTIEPPGGLLGSSPRLLGELRDVAPWLGIALDSEGGLDDQAAARLADATEDDPWHREKYAWLHLFEAARLSVELGTAVVFC